MKRKPVLPGELRTQVQARLLGAARMRVPVDRDRSLAEILVAVVALDEQIDRNSDEVG